MKAMRVITGIAVLLVALHFAHGIHHFFSMNLLHGTALWAAIVAAAVIDLLAFVGGVFLLQPRR